jgi:hypothetical protein
MTGCVLETDFAPTASVGFVPGDCATVAEHVGRPVLLQWLGRLSTSSRLHGVHAGRLLIAPDIQTHAERVLAWLYGGMLGRRYFPPIMSAYRTL